MELCATNLFLSELQSSLRSKDMSVAGNNVVLKQNKIQRGQGSQW